MQQGDFRNVLSSPDQLSQEAERLRAEAERLPWGTERRKLERKARQAEDGRAAERVVEIAGSATTKIARVRCAA